MRSASAAAQHVVPRVARLEHLAVVAERPAHDGRAERVGREQQIPLGDVGGQHVEVADPADELRLGDVKADLLQRRAVPGLHVELAVPLVVVQAHVVVRDHVPRPAKGLKVVLGPGQHGPGSVRRGHRVVRDRPDVLTVVPAAAQFLRDRERVVSALLSLPADEHHRVAQRELLLQRVVDAAEHPPLHPAMLGELERGPDAEHRRVIPGRSEPVALLPDAELAAVEVTQSRVVVARHDQLTVGRPLAAQEQVPAPVPQRQQPPE